MTYERGHGGLYDKYIDKGRPTSGAAARPTALPIAGGGGARRERLAAASHQGDGERLLTPSEQDHHKAYQDIIRQVIRLQEHDRQPCTTK